MTHFLPPTLPFPHSRKRSTWNPTQFAGFEHPSAFPSMLRASSVQPQSKSQLDIRSNLHNPLNKRDSFGSAVALNPANKYSLGKSTPSLSPKVTLSPSKSPNSAVPQRPLRRRESQRETQSQTRSTTLNRRESFGSNKFIDNQLGNGQRRDSFGSTLSRGDSLNLNVSKRDSYDGRGDLRRQSFGGSLYLRPDTSGSGSLTRRDSFGSQNLRNESGTVLNNGTSVFLRADSAGAGNLIRRDSLSGSQQLRRDVNNLLRRDSLASQNQRRDSVASVHNNNNLYRSSVPRDYVSKSVDHRDGHSDACAINNNHNHNHSPHDTPRRTTGSILRKDSIKHHKKHVSYESDTVDSPLNHLDTLGHQLTTANLTKHSTIMEENIKNERMKNLAKKLSFDEDAARIISSAGNRRERSGSTGSEVGQAYLESRRISVDSLDTRRNSWQRRGSQASADLDFAKELMAESEAVS